MSAEDPPVTPEPAEPTGREYDEDTAAKLIQVAGMLVVGALAAAEIYTGNQLDRWYLAVIGGIAIGVRPGTVSEIVRELFGRGR